MFLSDVKKVKEKIIGHLQKIFGLTKYKKLLLVKMYRSFAFTGSSQNTKTCA